MDLSVRLSRYPNISSQQFIEKIYPSYIIKNSFIKKELVNEKKIKIERKQIISKKDLIFEDIEMSEFEDIQDIQEIEEIEGNPFNLLSDELILHIFNFLQKPYEIVYCETTCSRFLKIIQESNLWMKMIEKNYRVLDFVECNKSSYMSKKNFRFFISFTGVYGLSQYLFERQMKNFLVFDSPFYQQSEKKKTNSIVIENVEKNLVVLPSKEEQEFIEENPRKFFLHQMNKFDKRIRECANHQKKTTKKSYKISNKLLFPLSGGIYPFIASVCSLLTILFVSLKMDGKMNMSYSVGLLFVMIFLLVTVYAGIILRINTQDNIETWLSNLLWISALFIFVFVLLLGLKLDEIGNFSWFIVAVPIFLLTLIILIKCWMLYDNHSSLNSYFTNVLLVYLGIFVFLISIFFLLLALYQEKISKFSMNSLFIILFVIGGSPLWFLCFGSAFIRFFQPDIKACSELLHAPTKYNSFWAQIKITSSSIFSLELLFLIFELLVCLKLNDRFDKSWIIVSIPLLIFFGFIFLFSIMLHCFYITGKYD